MSEPQDLLITMSSLLSNSVAKSTITLEESISQMKLSGMDVNEIKSVLMNDLNNGGRIFGSYRNAIKNTTKNGVGYNSNIASQKVYQDSAVEEFQWVGISDNKVCEDCEDRHGQTGTMEYFRTVGLPRSGFSICQTNCRCQLVPMNYKGENIKEPIITKKPESITSLKMAGKHTSIKDSEEWLKSNLKAKDIRLSGIDLDSRNRLNKLFKKHIESGANFKYEIIRSYNSKSNVVARSGTKELMLNKYHLKDVKKYEKNAKDWVASGWWHNGGDTFESIMSHEFGHGLHIRHIYASGRGVRINTEIGKKINDLYGEYILDIRNREKKFQSDWIASGKSLSDLRKYKDSFNTKLVDLEKSTSTSIVYKGKNEMYKYYKEVYGGEYISNYATENISEWIAECYSMAFHSKNPSSYAEKLKRLVLSRED